MNLKELKEILQILEDQEITEFELEQEGTKLRVRRGGGAPPAGPIPPPASAGVPALSPETSPLVATESPSPSPAEGGLTIVKSPIVGTFYRAPDPNSAPFVSVGDSVAIGQVLCIIEAMKLMNEIEAEVAGEIVKVHHESGQPVQYGEPLFTVRPAS
ncbi:MAG TPA: acetyl-CoA carboxylase biotin carboxyl carrier protein [Vicinamibacteria bacterium]